MATYTENYGLHQWEATDNFLRTDFNTDFEMIDEALGVKAEAITGTYSGNGGTSTRTISLGFRPRAVMVTRADGAMPSMTGSLYICGGLILDGHALTFSGSKAAEIVEGGFQIKSNGEALRMNDKGIKYHYAAVK